MFASAIPQVVTPQKCGDVYWYDLLPAAISTPPPSQRSSSCSHSTTVSSLSSTSSHSSYSLGSANGGYQHHHQTYNPYQNLPIIMAEPQSDDTYDTPKPAVHISFDATQRAAWGRAPPQQQQQQPHNAAAAVSQSAAGTPRGDDSSYDIPRPSPGLLSQHNITPSSSNSSLLTTTSDSLSLSSSNRSSMANMPDYDIPRRHPLSAVPASPQSLVATPTSATMPMAMMMSGANSTYDIPQLAPANGTHQSSFYVAENQSRHSMVVQAPSAAAAVVPTKTKELPLELSSALETLNKLQNEATSAVTRYVQAEA